MNQDITHNIKPPNFDLDVLKKNFAHCFDKDGNFDFEKFKNHLSQQEISFSTESYGLDWLGKSYARLLASDPATTLLKEDNIHNNKPENINAQNLLIKGDNLEVLKHLANAYYEQVKMIYIDPPYNTGSDGFVYQDDRKFTLKELQNLIGINEEKANRILTFTKQKSNSHSAWLTFIYPRLYIAKQLLKEDGVIFISIDDNEVAQLRLLMDEVFGEENFVAEFVWKKKAGGANDSVTVAIEHEYTICFKKQTNGIYKKPMGIETLKKYKHKDSKFTTHGYYHLKNLCDTSLQDGKGLHYDIRCPDNTFLYGDKNQWKCNKETFEKRLNDDRIEFKKNKNTWTVNYKIYLNEEKGILKFDDDGNPVNKGVNISSILKVGLNSESAIRIKELFIDNIFEYSKPVSLIKELLIISTNQSDLILDFFAGSGTTGDAVMQLNAEDGGNRKYILVQIPEAINPQKSKTAYDFVKNELHTEPTIFEITKERLLRAANKINEGLNEKINKLQKELPTNEAQAEIIQLKQQITQNNFKIIETIPIWDNYYFEADQFENTQTLFNESTLTEDDLKALLITWKTFDGIALTQNLESIKVGDYPSFYGNNKLYLMDKGFTTDTLKILLEKIDADKSFSPSSIIAFGYNFESARLRELAENIKSYANKKNMDIDFIIRY